MDMATVRVLRVHSHHNVHKRGPWVCIAFDVCTVQADAMALSLDPAVNWEVTRLPILACSRLHVYIGAICQRITGVVEFE
jgi:hypothetical protein